MEIQKQLQQHTPEIQFNHGKFPAHIKFDVVSVGSQHWNSPIAKNGKEYIHFIEKRFIKNIYKRAMLIHCIGIMT